MTIEREQGVGHTPHLVGWQASKRAVLGTVTVWQGDRLVAEVEVHNHDARTAVERARLIAAAPALLEALKKSRNTLAGCGMPKIAADICDAAIALASSDGKGSDNG